MNAPDFIDHLDPGERFVFGSNIRGSHIGGAAKQAAEQFGAEEGVGEGLTGQCYAFPTIDENMKTYEDYDLKLSKDSFYRCAYAHPELRFLLTPVGTGIASIPRKVIEHLFSDLPKNVTKVGW